MNKSLLLWNGGSGKAAAVDQLKQLLAASDQIEITRDIDLHEVVARSVENGCKSVIAAGGDGTVNAVVNALMRVKADLRPQMGIIPLGTANDFAGTLAIPDDLVAAVDLIESGNTQPVDVVHISAEHYERYYANMAAGGNCVRVSEALTDEIKATWGAFCYIRGAVTVLSDMTSFRIVADCDGERFELDSWAVLVANGKTNAGRIMVAPKASPMDGLIDVIIIREGDVSDMIEIVSKTLLSSFLNCEQVIFRQVKRLILNSDPVMRFTIDGEVIDDVPIEFNVVPGAIQVFHGPEFCDE